MLGHYENKGLMYRTPAKCIFKVYDPNDFGYHFLVATQTIDHLKFKEDLDAYRKRLQQWIDLGIHPNIVQARRIVEFEKNLPYVLTEVTETYTLRDLMNNGDGFLYEDWPFKSTRRMLNLLIQIASGI